LFDGTEHVVQTLFRDPPLALTLSSKNIFL